MIFVQIPKGKDPSLDIQTKAGIWLGVFENGNGTLFNLVNPNAQKSILGARKWTGSVRREFVCLFNCQDPNRISALQLEGFAREYGALSNRIAINSELQKIGFFRETARMEAVSHSKMRLVGRRQHSSVNPSVIGSGIAYLRQNLNGASSTNRKVGTHVITGVMFRIN